MAQKIFAGLLTGVLTVVGTSCGSVSQPVAQPDRLSETAVEESLDEMPGYFAEDFYVADNGEALPINAGAAELIEFAIPINFSEVAERAAIIVIGQPLESLEESDTSTTTSSPSQNFSVSDFEVEAVVKGDFQIGDVISLGQYAAVFEDKSYRLPESHANWNSRSLVVQSMANYRPVRKNSTYILFLYKRSDTSADVYFPVYESFGRVNVDGTDEFNGLIWVDSLAQRNIWEYAITLSQATLKDPTQNHLEQIIERADRSLAEDSN